MLRDNSRIDILTHEFLNHAKTLHADIEPIRVLKAKAFRIADSNVLIRVASLGKNNRYFFGLNYITAEEVANLDNSFFAFICGSLDNTVILPSHILMNCLCEISQDRNGEYKIVLDSDFTIVLKGRGKRFDCSDFINNWNLLLLPSPIKIEERNTAEQSIHTVTQGRLIEIGNIRGYQTFCPNKSKKFNNRKLEEITTLSECPQLQWSDYNLLRQIDVLWFKEKANKFIPEYAFEVEISTGTWSGVGRMSTLIDYSNVRLYIISKDSKKYNQVLRSLYENQSRYRHVILDDIGELYVSELNLKELRKKIDL